MHELSPSSQNPENQNQPSSVEFNSDNPLMNPLTSETWQIGDVIDFGESKDPSQRYGVVLGEPDIENGSMGHILLQRSDSLSDQVRQRIAESAQQKVLLGSARDLAGRQSIVGSLDGTEGIGDPDNAEDDTEPSPKSDQSQTVESEESDQPEDQPESEGTQTPDTEQEDPEDDTPSDEEIERARRDAERAVKEATRRHYGHGTKYIPPMGREMGAYDREHDTNYEHGNGSSPDQIERLDLKNSIKSAEKDAEEYPIVSSLNKELKDTHRLNKSENPKRERAILKIAAKLKAELARNNQDITADDLVTRLTELADEEYQAIAQKRAEGKFVERDPFKVPTNITQEELTITMDRLEDIDYLNRQKAILKLAIYHAHSVAGKEITKHGVNKDRVVTVGSFRNFINEQSQIDMEESKMDIPSEITSDELYKALLRLDVAGITRTSKKDGFIRRSYKKITPDSKHYVGARAGDSNKPGQISSTEYSDKTAYWKHVIPSINDFTYVDSLINNVFALERGTKKLKGKIV